MILVISILFDFYRNIFSAETSSSGSDTPPADECRAYATCRSASAALTCSTIPMRTPVKMPHKRLRQMAAVTVHARTVSDSAAKSAAEIGRRQLKQQMH